MDLALVSDDVALGHAALEDAAARRAGSLAAAGVRPGDRVAFVAEPTVETVLTIHAVWSLGATVVPIHPRLTFAERAVVLDEAAPVRFIETPISPGPPAPVRPFEPSAILFTSGTSGRPKAAVLPAPTWRAAATASEANLGWRDDDAWLLALTPAHVGGLSILVRCFLARRAVVVGPLTPETIARHRVTLLSIVPTQAHRLLAAGWTPSPSVRAILLGGGPAPPKLLAATRGWPILTTYGLTEACAQVTTQRPGTPTRGSGSPLPGVGVRISAAGTIQVGGPTLTAGYLRGPQPFTDDGWLETGDFGRLDEAGCLHVLGRRTDLIVSGGENVYPAEVEDALLELPGIEAACVFGQPDEIWGQVVCAALVGRRGVELRHALDDRLARFKQPRRVAWLDGLPLGPTGKVDRAAVIRHASCSLLEMEVPMPNQPNQPKQPKQPEPMKKDQNEGEGSKTAAKEYDDAATKHAKSGNVDKEAQDARRAIGGSENESLREAEKQGKSRMKEEDSELKK